MKRSIQIQIGLVIVSIFVLIGVLFYNPPDVEKPTEIVVDFGDGGKHAVGAKVASASTDEEAVPASEAVDPGSLTPIEEKTGEPKVKANGAAGGAKPAPVSPRAGILPKGTPPPTTPSPVAKRAPIQMPFGRPIVVDPETKIETDAK
ncbi:MAG: hypothetical protein ABI579_06475 [Candidatus Sumerlaeota bacterium]